MDFLLQIGHQKKGDVYDFMRFYSIDFNVYMKHL
jgi:hypothetical protein